MRLHLGLIESYENTSLYLLVFVFLVRFTKELSYRSESVLYGIIVGGDSLGTNYETMGPHNYEGFASLMGVHHVLNNKAKVPNETRTRSSKNIFSLK